MDIKTIHESLINGQRRQMVEQIDKYGGDFWEDYKHYLFDRDCKYQNDEFIKAYIDVTISYFRIKNR